MNGNDDKAHFEALEAAETAQQAGSAQIWERQPGESAKAYAAFSRYLGLNERRTMKKVGEMSGCSTQNIERWARRWSWTPRVYAYDAMEEARWREQCSRDRLNHHRRLIQLGEAVESIAAHGLAELQRKIEMKVPLDLRPDELATLLRLGSDLVSRGLGTNRESRFSKINVILRRQPDHAEPEEDKKPALIEGSAPPLS